MSHFIEQKLYLIYSIRVTDYLGIISMIMEKSIEKNGLVLDLSNANGTAELVSELSALMENPEISGKRIGLKLGVTKGRITHQIRVLRRDLNDIMGLDYDIPGIKSTRTHKRNRSHLKQEFKLKVS